jgi:hypothetical protein
MAESKKTLEHDSPDNVSTSESSEDDSPDKVSTTESSEVEAKILDKVISKAVKKYGKKRKLMKFGLPSYDTLRIRKGYVLSYDG